MQDGLAFQSTGHPTAMADRLRLEGWSLHQRLQCAPALKGASEGLMSWRAVVGPDSAANFDKRLCWDGLSPATAAWALNPPVHLVPTHPDWWDTS